MFNNINKMSETNHIILTLFCFLIHPHALLGHRMSPTSHYKEMKCAPLPSATDVQAFQCLFEKLPVPLDKCIYKGRLINIGEKIPDNECNVGCFCSKSQWEESPSFICAIVDCAEGFSGRNESCVYQYKLQDCCSSNQVCESKDILNLARCCAAGKSYFEGERFYPEDTCKTCVCGKGFSGKLEAPYCKPINCGIEMYQSNSIISRCAPVYQEGRDCCPIEWECYNDEVKIEKVGKKSKYCCTFGTQKLNIGDRVLVKNECLKCSCDYPPLVTCVADKNCQ